MRLETRDAMIVAAKEIEALIPQRPKTRLLGDRLSFKVYMLYYHSALNAYRYAAAECLLHAADTADTPEESQQIMGLFTFLDSDDRSLEELKATCEPEYDWLSAASIY
jgi:hypothetical protein